MTLTRSVGHEAEGRFLDAFYASLFRTGQVDVAASTARRAVADVMDPGSAVLFSQRSDDTILDV